MAQPEGVSPPSQLPTVQSPPKDVSADVAGLENGLADVKQLGFFAAFGTLGYVFWVVGGMEMVERLAYYGVKAVATLYAKDPVSAGGLGITLTSFGVILSVWAMVESILPAFIGGLSDRHGYKQTIFVATILKIAGYLTMAAFMTYAGFFAGAVLLAAGTAVFRPGIQGTLVKATRRDNSSMAWGLFYQLVNIGGFLGPLIAGFLRKMEWQYVFLVSGAIASLNLLLLLTYREPGKEERVARARALKQAGVKQESLWRDSLRELRKPHVWTYLAIFSGFWFMFNSLFDVLPAHIDDWVNTHDIVATLFGTGGTESAFVKFFVVLDETGTRIQPEGMLNINAGLIMITCFLFAWLSGKLRATTSMVIGTLFASAAMFASGLSTLGWVSVGAISIFSVGEMLSSPKFNEFIGNIAPSDKKAMYLGFAQIPLALGWTLEGYLGPMLYDQFASKDRFAREYLVDQGLMSAASADAIPQGEAFQRLVEVSGQTAEVLTRTLHDLHDVWVVWAVMGGVGVLSAVGIYVYGRWIKALVRA